MAPLSADADDDGILDEVDTNPAVGSNDFADDNGPPPTTGTIVDRAGLPVLVEDVDAPDGVKVAVGGGTGQAELSVCGQTVFVEHGTEAVFTCGSLKVEVLTGAVDVVLGDGVTVISVPEGVTAHVTENPDGSFEVENLGGGDDTVTVDGEETTIGEGETSTVTTWHFVGFNKPVDNNGVLNSLKAGQAVPLKWRLLNADGTPVTNLTTAKITATHLNCGLGTTTDLLEESSPGGSGLKNLGNGYYQLEWKTPKSYAGSCKTLHLDLGEGITRDALFKFTK
jgi:hypothetical protein